MATGEGNAVSKALGGVIGIASQGNIILAGIVQGIALYRQARDAWKASHPDGQPAEGEDNPNWLEDDQLIALLKQDSDKLVAHAGELLTKYAAAPAPPEG